MKVLVKRIFSNSRYTIGKLYVDGVWICDVIEDSDLKEFSSTQSTSWILNNKCYGRDAIPTGVYDLTMDIVSPSFSKKTYYKKFCNGKLPRLIDVPAYSGILIHRGSTEKDSAGCLIVGYNTIKGQVTNSQKAFEKLYKILDEANKRGEKITIEIQRCWKKV